MQIQTKSLLSELQWAARFTDKSPQLPILSHVLFTVEGKRLTLTGTDLEIAGVTTVEGAGRGAWSVAAPVVRLIKYLQKVDEPQVTLSTDERHGLTVTHGTDTVRTDGMSQESYPELPQAPTPQATLGNLPQAIERVLFTIAKEETRFTLSGALLEADEGIARLVATDGHRLSIAPLQIDTGSGKVRALLSKRALHEAGNLEGDCTFAAQEDHVFLNWGQRRIVARKLKGNFPDWRRVMVWEPGHYVMVPVESGLKTLDRVAIYADTRSRTASFTVDNGKLTIKAASTEGSGEGSVPVIAGKGDEPFTAGYNATYISEFLSKVKAHPYVAFCWQADDEDKPGATKAAVFTTADQWSYVVMPMRMN